MVLRRNCKVTPIQAKLRVGNRFRDNAIVLNTYQADKLIQTGYEILMESEWHYLQQTYLYKYIAPVDTHQDQGRNNI